MVSDKNRATRAAYNEKIAATEQAIEELAIQRKKIRDALDNFERMTKSEFNNLIKLDEELAQGGSKRAVHDLDDTAAQVKMLQNFLTTQEENFGRTFAQEQERLEEERAQLQRARDVLPVE